MSLETGSSLAAEKDRYLRPISPISHVFGRFWETSNFAVFPVGAAYCSAMYPAFAPPFIAAGILGSYLNLRAHMRYPAFTPKTSRERIDPNLYKDGSDTEKVPPAAIYCMGVCRKTGLQVWIPADLDLQHHKTIATTGGGKTFGLMFRVMMSLIQTSGLVVVDGKGDESFPRAVWSMLRRFGRETDFRFLNFKQGSQDKYYKDSLPLSNTFNPFAKATRSAIAEMLKSLLSQDGEGAGKGDFWAQRANTFVDLLARIVAYQRDHFGHSIRVGYIREYLDLRKLIHFYVNEEIPAGFKGDLKSYFSSIQIDEKDIPAYAEGQDFKGKIIEQHSYVSMQLQPALSILADDYGYIFDTDTPDIDMEDVAINNRCLFCLLPALQKSPATTQNTGRIILAALKSMISSQLGEGIEGDTEKAESAKAMSDSAPFHVELDESGYYAAIDGIQQLPAQGRGLGFSFNFIAQTFLDWQAAGGKVAEVIWGNTNNTTVGKIEDDETFEKLSKRIGQRVVLEQSSVDVRMNAMGIIERNMPGQLTVQKKDVVEFSDFTRLRAGQFNLTFANTTLNIRTGDPSAPQKVKTLRQNHFIGLSPYSEQELKQQRFDYSRLNAAFNRNLVEKKSPFASRIKLPQALNGIVSDARMKHATTGALSIEQWQKLLFDIGEVKRRVDEDAADATKNAALAFARKTRKPSKKKASAAKNKDEGSSAVDESTTELSNSARSWFASHTGDMDIDTDNKPTKSAALQSWQEYEVDPADDDREIAETALDYFNQSFDKDMLDSDVVRIESETSGLKAASADTSKEDDKTDEGVDTADNEDYSVSIASDSEGNPSSIDEALDRVGLDFEDSEEEDTTGSATEDDPPHQLAFPGVDFDGQPAVDKPAPDYPPKTMTTNKRGIDDIVRDNVSQLSGLLDLDL